jgi:hypothetical protein
MARPGQVIAAEVVAAAQGAMGSVVETRGTLTCLKQEDVKTLALSPSQ